MLAKYRQGWIRFGHGGWCHDTSRTVRTWLHTDQAGLVIHNWTRFVYAEDREKIRALVDTLQQDAVPAPTSIRWIGLHGKVIATDVRILVRKYAADGAPQAIIARLTRLRPEQVA